jgi:gliding motility-associated-like protein
LNISGVYRDTLINSKGCDSFLVLHLAVNEATRKDSFRTICKNQFVVFNGSSLNTSGVYRDTLVNSKGCDSFLVLNLTVNDTTKYDSFLKICKNYAVIFNGVSRSMSGTYKDTLVNVTGCDSFVYLHLTVIDTTRKDSFLTIFNNYLIVFNGQTLNKSGIYRDTLVNSNGCDSFIVLTLTVNDTTKNALSDIVLPNYFSPNGDGVNDNWVLPDAMYSLYPNLKVIIYNRWGNIVWRSTGVYQNDWGGVHQKDNLPVPDGVYYYLIELDSESKKPISGFVEVMRQ